MSDRPPISPDQRQHQPQIDNEGFQVWKAAMEERKRFQQEMAAYKREQTAKQETAQLSPDDLETRLTPLIRRIVREVLAEERDR
jgi:pheromone shutdown protein TraB